MADQSPFAARTLVGSGASGATRADLLIGRRGSPLEAAWAGALVGSGGGAQALVVELRPGLPVRPATLVSVLGQAGGERGHLADGPAHAAVAGAIAHAVEEDLVPRDAAPDLLVLVAVALDPATDDADAVFAAVHAATIEAVTAAVAGTPTVDEVLAEARHPWNARYHRHRN